MTDPKCMNCGYYMNAIEINLQGLAVGFACPNPSCGDEYWPYDTELPDIAHAEDLSKTEPHDSDNDHGINGLNTRGYD